MCRRSSGPVKFLEAVVLFSCLIFNLPGAWTGFECLHNPCLFGICIDDINSEPHQCYCIDGFTGYSCQINWNECNSQPCLNGGECFDGIASFNCTCPENFAGTQCEYDLTECDAFLPCLNNGTCSFNPQLIEPGKNGTGFYCSCPVGFSGPQCEEDISICNSTQSVCLNGGTCRDGIGDKFYCDCLPGWSGSTCEHDIDDCHSQPCQNGGVCVDRINDFSCACPFGYTGQLCETKLQICEENPCKNGAFCLAEDGVPICYCVPDYHGKLCEERYDECELNKNDNEPKCYNGGTCIDGVGEFTCSCPPGFYGPTCQCTEYNMTEPECQGTRVNVTINSTIAITGTLPPTWSFPTPTLTTVDLTGIFSPTMSDFPDVTSTISPSLGFSTDFLGDSDELTITVVDSSGDLSTATLESTLPPFSDLIPTPTTPWEDKETVSPTFSLPPPWATNTAYPENSTWLDYSSPSVTDESSTIFMSPMPSESTVSYEPTSTTVLMSESTAVFPQESTDVMSSETGSYSVDVTPTLEISTVSMTPTEGSSVFLSESIYPSETYTGPFETATPPTFNETTTEGPGLINATSTEEPSANTTTTEQPSANTTSTEEPSVNASTTTTEEPSAHLTTTEEPLANSTTTTEEPLANSTTTTEEPLANSTTTTEEPSGHLTTTEQPLANTTTTEEASGHLTTTEEPLANTTTTEEPSENRTTTEEPLANTTITETPVKTNATTMNPTSRVSEEPVTVTSTSTDSAVTLNFTVEPEPVTSLGTQPPTTMNTTVSEEFVTVTSTSTESSVTMNLTISEGPATATSTESVVTGNVTVPIEPGPGTQVATDEPESRTGTNSDEHTSTEGDSQTTTEFSRYTQPITPTSFEVTTSPSANMTIGPVITPPVEPVTTSRPETNGTDPCSNYCQNNAKCISTSIEPICICPFKFAGRQCEIVRDNISVPSFKGSSFLQYKLPSESVRVVDVSLKIATIVPEGVVLYTASEGSGDIARNLSYGLIFLQNGHLVLHFSCGSQSMEFVETRTRVNNGYNFTLDFRMEMVINGMTNELHCVGKLSVNQSFVMSGEQLVGRGSLPYFENIYVGGVDQRVARSGGNSDVAMFLPGLRGCVYSLLVNQEVQEMYDQAMDGKEIGECETFACVINPCFGNAECVPTNKLPFWECMCPPGYAGNRCQIEKCESDPCSNGGTCTPSPLLRSFPNNTEQVACLCPFGFSGLRCQNKININKPSFHPTLAYSSYMSYYGIPRFEDWFQMKFHFVTTNFSQISLLMYIGNTVDPTTSSLPRSQNLADSESEEQIESPIQEDSADKIPDFFSISFLQGFIAVTWNLGSGTQRVITPSPVDHRLNVHTLFAGRAGRQAWLKVDGMRNTTGKSSGPLYRLNIDSDLYIGGYESFQFEGLPHDLPLHTGFQGCIFDLGFRVKNKLYLPKSFRGRNVKNCFEDC